MAQVYNYPPTGASSANPSVGLNGLPIPLSSTLVAGKDPTGLETPIAVDSNGDIIISPTGPVTVVQPNGALLHATIDASALPTGAATSANQTNGAQQTQIVQGGNTALVSSSGGLVISGLSAVGTAPTNNPVSISGVDGGGLKRSLLTDTSGRLEIDTVQSLPLPSGASTAALQTTGNTSLGSIDTKTPALVAGRVPVDGSGVTQPVSGSVTVTQAIGTNLHTVVDASALPTGAATSANQTTSNASLASIDSKLTAPLAVTGPLTDIQLRASAVPVSAAALPLPTGAATSANQTTSNASLASIDSKLTAPLAVTGPLTDTQLRASAVAVSAAALPLPAGAATSTLQTTGNASLVTIANNTGNIPTVGQKISASSLPVVIASDQSAIPVSGTLSVTGVSTAANQTNGTQKTQVVDGSGNVIGSALVSGVQRLAVTLAAGGTPGVTAPNYTDVIGAVDTATGFTQQLQVDSSKNLKVNLQTALPAGTNALGSVAIAQGGNTAVVSSGGALIVAGLAAVGTALINNPISVSGVDGGGLKRSFLTDASGRLEINAVQSLPAPSGRTPRGFVRNVYSVTPVTTAAYVQLFASTSGAVTLMEIFDSSGQTLKIAFGAAASEVDQFLVIPGGNGPISIAIPALTRVSIRAVSGNASSGEIDINLYG